MKKRSKKILAISLISLLVIAVFGVYYFSTRQSLIGCSTITGSSSLIDLSGKQDIIWNNFNTQITSTYLGSIVSPTRNYVNGYYQLTGCAGGDYNSFSITNSYSNEDILILNSEIKHIKEGSFSYGAENYIQAKINFEKSGIVTFDYSSSSSGFDSHEDGYLKINSDKKNDMGIYTIEVKKGEKVSILLITIAPHSGMTSDSATLKISFEADQEVIEEFKENQTDISNPPIIPSKPNDVLENPKNYIPLIILVSIVLLIIMFLLLKKKRGKK